MVCLLFHLLCNEYYQNPQFPAILCKIFVLRLVHILRNFRSINILYIHSINTSNLFPYKKSTAKPFPEPGGRGGGEEGGTYYEGLYVGFRPTGGPFSGFI